MDDHTPYFDHATYMGLSEHDVTSILMVYQVLFIIFTVKQGHSWGTYGFQTYASY